MRELNIQELTHVSGGWSSDCCDKCKDKDKEKEKKVHNNRGFGNGGETRAELRAGDIELDNPGRGGGGPH